MKTEKVKRKNGYKTNVSPTQALHARIMKIPDYILAAAMICSGVIMLFFNANSDASFLAMIIFFGALIIYCDFYFASRFSVFLLTNRRKVTQTTATLILCVVMSIIICIFFGFFPIFVPIALLFTIYSQIKKKINQ